jgi:hypothetical protein
MPSTATAGAAPGAGAAPASGGTVPFFYGTNRYVQKFDTFSQQLTTTTVERTQPVTAGGFLRGIRLQLRSTGGVGGTTTADNPWNVFQSITLENVNGAALQYPMSGYAYYTMSWASRPWWGDPARRYDFAAGPNPSGSLFIAPEITNTAGVLANTDARSQYRIRYTLNTAANVITSGSTAPTVTVTAYAEIWAQPDSADLHGAPIQPLPDGLNLQTLRRHQVLTLNAAGSSNQLQLTNVGNELRCVAMIVRDSNQARQDYFSDPIRWTLDDRNLGVFSPDEVFQRMGDFYDSLSNSTSQRPTGVYVFPRFLNQTNGSEGEAWLATNNATYLNWEVTTLSTATNVPGTVEIITDEVVPVGPVPPRFESI